MADIAGIDPTTGQPTTVPQEAAAEAFKSGKLRFKPGERIPVTVGGVDGSMLAEQVPDALEEGDAELNFDPHGTAKAAAAGFARGLTLGGSDWLAVEGQKILGDTAGAEKTRRSLDALRRDHGIASTTGELAGAVAPSLIPGGAEAEAIEMGGRGAQELALADHALSGAQVEAATGQTLANATQAAKSAALAQAQTGATRGSLLAQTLRGAHTLNPYNVVGKFGGTAESAITRILGEGRLGRTASTLGRYAAEGGALGAASAADEAELGDYPLTGEAILADAEHGALWGSALGLVATAGSRIVTSAGRMAERLAEGDMGAPQGMLRKNLSKFGPGGLGARILAEGGSPFESAEHKYERWAGIKERDGAHLGQVVKDADSTFDGASAQGAFDAVADATKDPLERYGFAGGNGEALRDRFLKETRDSLGLHEMPPEIEPTLPHHYEEEYEQLVKQGVDSGALRPLDDIKKPRPPTKTAIAERAGALAERAGLHQPIPKPAEVPRPPHLTKRAIAERAEALAREAGLSEPVTPRAASEKYKELLAKVPTLPTEERQKLSGLLSQGDGPIREAMEATRLRALEELGPRVKAEMITAHSEQMWRYRADLKEQEASYERAKATRLRGLEATEGRAKAELSAAHAKQMERYHADAKAYDDIRETAHTKVDANHTEAVKNRKWLVEKYTRENAAKRVSFEAARDLRVRFDKVIPRTAWNNGDSVAHAANDVKMAARSALEGHIEAEMDAAASKVGDKQKLGEYLHAKHRYAQSNAIAEAFERGRARHANMYGRPTRVGGVSSAMLMGIEGIMHGHPLLGVAGGVLGGAARHYGPKVLAWAAHRASRLANLKAVRQELEIATRRNLRASLGQAKGAAGNYARVGLPAVPPHELRMTAAEAMAHIHGLSMNPAGLRSRLAAMDPGAAVIAPQSFNSADGAFRRQVMFLAAQIPHRFSEALQRGETINPRDLSDGEARDFMQNALVMADPRSVTDALNKGTLTTTMVKAQKAGWPAIHNNATLQWKRMVAQDRASLDFLHPGKKNAIDMLFHSSDPDFTLNQQAISQIGQMSGGGRAGGGNGGGNTMGAPRGMQHASATSKGMAPMVQLMSTQAQMAESGAPGRRGKRGGF